MNDWYFCNFLLPKLGHHVVAPPRMHSLFNAHFCSPYSDDFDAVEEQFLAWDTVFIAVVKWDDQTVPIRLTHLPETYADFQAGSEVAPGFRRSRIAATPVFCHEFGRKWGFSLGGCVNRISTDQTIFCQILSLTLDWICMSKCQSRDLSGGRCK